MTKDEIKKLTKDDLFALFDLIAERLVSVYYRAPQGWVKNIDACTYDRCGCPQNRAVKCSDGYFLF